MEQNPKERFEKIKNLFNLSSFVSDCNDTVNVSSDFIEDFKFLIKLVENLDAYSKNKDIESENKDIESENKIEKEIEIAFKNFTCLYITCNRFVYNKTNNQLEVFDINNRKMFYINEDEIMYYSIKQ